MSTEVAVPEIIVDPELRFGEYVNAVRLLPDGDDEVLLDLAVFSPQAQEARVVSRLRCRPSFLRALRDKLDSVLAQPPPPQQGVMLTTDGGKTAVVFPLGEGEES